MTAAWLGGPDPAMRRELHFGDRIVGCFPDRLPSLHALLAEQVRVRPQAEAVVCGADRLTWSELDRRVDRLAGGLRGRGIGRGDRIGLLIGNRAEFAVVLLAAARLGAVAVPMGIRQPGPEVAFALDDCGAVAVVHDAELADRIPDLRALPSLVHRLALPRPADGSDPLAGFYGAACAPEAVAEEETAVILYTSGTTGRPKGARLSHLGIVHGAGIYRYCFGLGPETRTMTAVPLSHVTGLVAGLAVTLACGGALLIMPEFRARPFLELAARERMTFTIMVPAMYNLCLLQPDLDRFDLSAWRIGGYGGAPMPPATITALADRLPGLLLANIYGATETTSPVTIVPPHETARRGDTVGRAGPGMTVLIADENGRELPPGEAGEIWLHGPSITPGYWGNEAATRAGIAGGFWRSGDIGSVDRDGYLRVLDRKKDMLNRGGFKIYTAEVEAVLAAHPAVIESAVVGRPCPVLGERVHAVVVVRDEAVPADGLQRFCAERLSDYKVPETFRLQAEPLPRNSNGKVMKRDLRAV